MEDSTCAVYTNATTDYQYYTCVEGKSKCDASEIPVQLIGTSGVMCVKADCPAPTVKNEDESRCISTERPTQPPSVSQLTNCSSTYVAGTRTFRYCVRDQPSYAEVVSGFLFQNYSQSVEQYSLFARLGRLRRVTVRATVQNASPFALIGLVTSAAIEECSFDVFLGQTTTSHGLLTHADSLRVIDAVVQIGSAPNADVSLNRVAGLAWKAVGPVTVAGVRIWLDGTKATEAYGLFAAIYTT